MAAQVEAQAQAGGEVTNLRALLSQPSDQVDRPKAMPTAHYLGKILSTEFTKTRGSMENGVLRQTDILRVNVKLTGPGPDAAADATISAQIAGVDWSRKEIRKDYFLTPAAMYRLTDLLDAVLGAQPGKTFDERIPDLRSADVLVQLLPSTDRNGVVREGFNDVGTIVAA
jgi:hypothetical protein